jgi:hypothetical protein
MKRKEIIYNLINSGIAGALVFAGALASGQITKAGLIAALGASIVVFLTKFKEYWAKQIPAPTGLFCFV